MVSRDQDHPDRRRGGSLGESIETDLLPRVEGVADDLDGEPEIDEHLIQQVLDFRVVLDYEDAVGRSHRDVPPVVLPYSRRTAR
jgi:hypothetical protein